ncbi:hypothetical protein FA13DRAFT_1723752, partial [Coprinellus micaceus]
IDHLSLFHLLTAISLGFQLPAVAVIVALALPYPAPRVSRPLPRLPACAGPACGCMWAARTFRRPL